MPRKSKPAVGAEPKPGPKSEAKSAKDSVAVEYAGVGGKTTRTFSKEIHGENYLELAKDFAVKFKGKIK